MRKLCFTFVLGLFLVGFSVSAQDSNGWLCIQSDTGSGLLVFNSRTGDYKFVRCKDGVAFSGTGQVTVDGCQVVFSDNRPTHTISASVNTCVQQGKAQVVVPVAFSPDGVTTIPAMNEILGDTNLSNNTCSCEAVEKPTDERRSRESRSAEILGGDQDFIGPPDTDGTKETIVKSDGGEAFIVFNTKTGDYKFVRCDGIAFSGTGQIRNDGCFTILEDNREDYKLLAVVNVCARAGKFSVEVFKAFSTPDGVLVPVMNVGFGDSDITNSTPSCF